MTVADRVNLEALKDSVSARFTAEQIAVVVDFADRLYLFRESTRNLALLQNTLLPKGQQALEIAQSGYISGQLHFSELIDAQRTLLAFKLAEVDIHTQREILLAEISLLLSAVPPSGAPLLIPNSINDQDVK